MVLIKNCCCCSLRTACLVFGGFALIGSILQLGNDATEVAKFGHDNEEQREAAIDNFYIEMTEQNIVLQMDDVRIFFKINFYLTIPNLLLNIGILISSACLLWGVRRESKNLLLPVMVVLPFDLILRIFILFALIIIFGISHPISMTTCAIFLYRIAFDIVILLCVFSHWQQLQQEDPAA